MAVVVSPVNALAASSYSSDTHTCLPGAAALLDSNAFPPPNQIKHKNIDSDSDDDNDDDLL